MSDMQAATHLKGLANKAKLNEKHVKIARIYKAKVASLTSERARLQERAQHMTEEIERLKYDLKHTFLARAWAERREDEVRSSLTTAEASFRRLGVSFRLRRMIWLRLVRGCSLPRVSFNWSGRNSSPPGASNGIFKRSYARLLVV